MNKYIVENEPWALQKSPRSQKLDSVLFHAAESLRLIAALLTPVVPKTAQNSGNSLGWMGRLTSVGSSRVALEPGPGGKADPRRRLMFPRLDPKEVMKKMESTSGASGREQEHPEAATAAAPDGQSCAADHDRRLRKSRFARRNGDRGGTGQRRRTNSCVWLSIWASKSARSWRALLRIPTRVADRPKVVIVANLQPRKLRGLESNGMIVAASLGPRTSPYWSGFHEDVDNGARLK